MVLAHLWSRIIESQLKPPLQHLKSPSNCKNTSIKEKEASHRLAMPAFLTAVEMAFTAVQMEFSRLVSSPVPWAFLPSSRTNLVRVRTLVSKAAVSDIFLPGVGPGAGASSGTDQRLPGVKKRSLGRR